MKINKLAISTISLSIICAIAFAKGGDPKDFSPECPQKERVLNCAPWKRWQSTPIHYRVCEFKTVGGASFYVKNSGNRTISFSIDLTFVDGSTDNGGRLTLRGGAEEGFTCPRCRRGEPGLRKVRIYKMRYED
jgi:hypothetical protein